MRAVLDFFELSLRCCSSSSSCLTLMTIINILYQIINFSHFFVFFLLCSVPIRDPFSVVYCWFDERKSFSWLFCCFALCKGEIRGQKSDLSALQGNIIFLLHAFSLFMKNSITFHTLSRSIPCPLKIMACVWLELSFPLTALTHFLSCSVGCSHRTMAKAEKARKKH